MHILWNAIFFLVLIGVLVTIHEYGHFIVARQCGVKVLTFAIGFGKSIYSWHDKQGTEFVIKLLPLGGYVRMLDSRVDHIPLEDKKQSFDTKPALQRIAIVFAGPAFNFIFAFFALWLMLITGMESTKPVIGEVKEDSIAETAKLKPHDIIVSVNQQAVKNWQDVQMEFAGIIGQSSAEIEIKNETASNAIRVQLNLIDWKAQPEKQSLTQSLGITPYYPKILTEVAKIATNSPAEGILQENDVFISIDDQLVDSWPTLNQLIKARANQNCKIVVVRNYQEAELFVKMGVRNTPTGEIQGYLGFTPKLTEWPKAYKQIEQYDLFDAIPVAINKTWHTIKLSFMMVGKLISGDVSLKSLSGPVSIAEGAGTTASYGLVYFLSFMAFISINLGIINLLPLPVLDGGQLLYYLIELISGKPVPEKVQEVGFRIGIFIIFSLMSIAIFNDLSRL